MNRSELERRVAERTGLASSAAKGAVDAVFDVIAEALASGEDARVSGFGVFGTRARPARIGRNPRTGESVSIAASTAPTFKPGKALKDAVNAETGT
ncbi:MAG: HU family DNA-binding protein [Defluviicoccus sp.]|nr:HU family DNA-binding protein [Defluviicoccus sp.]